MSHTSIKLLLCLAISVGGVSSCVPLAVGAAAGYVARDNGYEVQSPIKKKDQESYDQGE